MITIISATNRYDSRSIQLANLYQNLLKNNGAESQIVSLRELPKEFLFSALYENTGKDFQFNEVVEKMRSSEKFVFIIPEYNGSFPGVLKAFIDGLSYPSPFAHKKGALVGLGSGAMGGALALSHFTDILNYLGMNILATKVRLPKIESLLKEGTLKDKFLANLLETQAKGLTEF